MSQPVMEHEEKTQFEMQQDARKVAPMRGLPLLIKKLSINEAQVKKRDWVPPNVIAGEVVFYRKHGTPEEFFGIVSGAINKTWTVWVFRPGQGIEERKNVSYYDHTGPEEKNDPYGAHNSNGTFRRTIFGQTVERVLNLTIGKVDSSGEIEAIRAQLEALRGEVGKLIAANAAAKDEQPKGKQKGG